MRRSEAMGALDSAVDWAVIVLSTGGDESRTRAAEVLALAFDRLRAVIYIPDELPGLEVDHDEAVVYADRASVLCKEALRSELRAADMDDAGEAAGTLLHAQGLRMRAARLEDPANSIARLMR